MDSIQQNNLFNIIQMDKEKKDKLLTQNSNNSSLINNKKSKFKFVDLFSGIGGFREALEKLDGTSVGFSEIDKFAKITYSLNYNDPVDHDLGDVTLIKKLPKLDVLVGGVPCQSWSIAGKKKGFDDPRGRLWFDTINMVKLSMPKVFVFENVKGLADPRNSENLDLIINSFKNIGYIIKYDVLNTFNFGLPQNRSRIFIVGFRGDMKKFANKFNFPVGSDSGLKLSNILEGVEKVNHIKKKINRNDLYGDKIPMSRNVSQKIDEFNDFFVFCDTRNGHTTIHSWDIKDTSSIEKNICMAILKNRRKKIYGSSDGNPLSFHEIKKLVPDAREVDINSLVNKRILKIVRNGLIDLVNSKNSAGVDGIYRIFLPNSTIFSTLTATGTKDFVATKHIKAETVAEYKRNFINEIFKKKNFRPVSVSESLQIQGFDKKHKMIDKTRFASKQIGNSVSPIVVRKLFEKILDTGLLN